MNIELFLGWIGLREYGLRKTSSNPGELEYSAMPFAGDSDLSPQGRGPQTDGRVTNSKEGICLGEKWFSRY